MSALQLRPALRAVPGYRVVRFIYIKLFDPNGRALLLSRLAGRRGLFQPHGATSDNRYPIVFQLVRERTGDGPHVQLLSFGCSTGEEVISIRRYFPKAAIKGIDINPRSIRICKQRLAHSGDISKTTFDVADSAVGEEPERYDAIFAMAVFRHGDLGSAPSRCDHRIRFADFERTMASLVRALKPGGLLAIHHANFRVSDTSLGLVRFAGIESPVSPTPVYGSDNCLCRDGSRDDGIYQKPRNAVDDRAPADSPQLV